MAYGRDRSKRMKTVLLVEDTDDDVVFLKRALQDAGIHNPLRVVQDGQEALDYMEGTGAYADRNLYPLPFLVLLDLKLPQVMGLEVLKWIRDRPAFEGILIVVLTTSQHDKDIETAYRLGGNCYLIKPPNGHKLTELIKALEDDWRPEQERPQYQ